MMRTMISLAALGLATTASAATISVDSDKAMYLPGETIAITTTLTTTGSEPQTTVVQLELLWDGSLTTAAGPTIQTALTSFVFLSWTAVPVTCLASSCLVLDQISPISPTGSIPDPATITTTLEITAGSTVGLLNFSFGATVNLFGAVPTMGVNLAAAQIVPEPGTAALLGLGLTGLAFARRRRMSLSFRRARRRR